MRSPRWAASACCRSCRDAAPSSGVTVRYRTLAPDPDALRAEYDLVVASDGANSATRARYAETFRPTVEVRACKYMWLGTDQVFDAFKFYVRETPHGVMQIHGYPYSATGSTFIIEMNEAVWRRAGFDSFADRTFEPGESDEKSAALVAELFADVLDGHQVLTNNSKWISFATVRNERWRHDNVVLLGDAAHTAHFSIGSGHEARDGGRARARRLPARAARHRHRAVRVRGRAPAGRAVHPARGPGQPRVVREHRAVLPPGAAAVRVQHHDPQPPGHLRQPAAARPRVRRAGRPLLRRGRARPRARHRRREPADVPAVPARRPGARQPGRGLADGHVRRRRRDADRLPSRPSRRQGARRRRAGVHRDGLRVTRGADHPRLHRASTPTSRPRSGGGSPSSSTASRRRRSPCSSATPAARGRRS